MLLLPTDLDGAYGIQYDSNYTAVLFIDKIIGCFRDEYKGEFDQRRRAASRRGTGLAHRVRQVS